MLILYEQHRKYREGNVEMKENQVIAPKVWPSSNVEFQKFPLDLEVGVLFVENKTF